MSTHPAAAAAARIVSPDLIRPVAIAAEDLRPGDVVVDADGVRRFAAFDRSVNHDDQGKALTVTVWPAVRDIPTHGEVLGFPADAPLLIRPRPSL